MTMKRRNQTICAVLLSTLLVGIPVQAEIPEIPFPIIWETGM